MQFFIVEYRIANAHVAFNILEYCFELYALRAF